jgi:hypothetical protein
MEGLSVAPPATVSGPVGEPTSASLAAHRIARLGAFDAASLCRVRIRRRLFLRSVAGGLRRWLRLKRDGPAYNWNGPHRVQSMVHDGRLIRLRSGAHGRALSCGRLHDKSGGRDSAADGRDNYGKKEQPLDAQGFSLLRHRAGARPTGLANQRSYGELTFRFGNLPYRFRRIRHFEGVSLTVLREMAGHRPRRKTGGNCPFSPGSFAPSAPRFLGKVSRRMPVNEQVRSASRFNATMHATILILAN